MTPEKLALKRAFAETVKGVGGLEAAAGFCRVGKSVLGANQSVNDDESFAALDVVADLEPLARDRAGWPHVTQALCLQMGGTFVALPDAPVSKEGLLARLAQQAQEQNDLTQTICTGLADGTFCSKDAAKALRDVDDVIRVAAAMRAELKMLVDGE